MTVGVDMPDRCQHVLRAAAAEAASRGATLHVLHAWSFPSPCEAIVMSRTDDEEWARRATVEIQGVFDMLGRRRPTCLSRLTLDTPTRPTPWSNPAAPPTCW